MAHEMTKSDNVVMFGEGAWHGLGTVVQERLMPSEMVAQALPWEPMTVPLMRLDNAEAVGHVAIIRDDTRDLLGVASERIALIYNRIIGAAGDAIVKAYPEVSAETSGSIRGGKKVYLSLRDPAGDAEIVKGDEVKAYHLMASGHDGTSALIEGATIVRPVCSNTYHMGLAEIAASGRGSRFSHARRYSDGEIITAIVSAFGARRIQTAAGIAQAQRLAASPMTGAQVQAFFVDVYSALIAPIPTEVKTERDAKARAAAAATVGQWANLFDAPTNRVGSGAGTKWAATSAVNEWLCHHRPTRGDRATSNLIGAAADLNRKLMAYAVGTLA